MATERAAIVPRLSPRLPDRFVAWAREREIVIIAGANQALKYRRRILLGRGTRERPFEGTQSIDAAIAVRELSGTGRRVLIAWGYGRALDPGREYFYRTPGGPLYEIRFVDREGIGNSFNYSEPAARADAWRLEQAVSADANLCKRPLIFVGCSWGAAVIDYALTHGARQGLSLPGVGIAIGGPRHLFAPSSPLRPCALSENGDYRDLWVQRHPDDPIGKGGFGPLLYFRNTRLHDYRIDGPAGGVWGISGPWHNHFEAPGRAQART
jgi:hypothetical protein